MGAGDAPHMSMLSLLLHEGGPEGLGLFVLGLMLTTWGLCNLAFVPNRGLLLAQALLSFVPLGLAVLGLFRGLDAFLAAASASGLGPGPEVIAHTVVHALAIGILGALCTGVPAIIGIAALSRDR